MTHVTGEHHYEPPEGAAAPRAEVAAPSSIEDFISMQSALPNVYKDSENPHFHNRYASLHAITDAVFPVLARFGFAWITCPHVAAGGSYLDYQLVHKSGDIVATGHYPLPEGTDPQKLGSALTYSRRYSLCAVLGLVADEDDDGTAASPQRAPQAAIAPGNPIREAVAPQGMGLTDEQRFFPHGRPAAEVCVACKTLGWVDWKGNPPVFEAGKYGMQCTGKDPNKPKGKNSAWHKAPVTYDDGEQMPLDESDIPF